jgi:hypothetical protein
MPEADAAGRLTALGLQVPRILLPREGTDLYRWAVIACDQFTQDRDAWEQIRRAAGTGPSTLGLIYPEAYLAEPDRTERIAAIHRTMRRYLAEEIFAAAGAVYVERDTPFAGGRRGLLMALDLERYDWKAGAAPLIRPTEGTVPERLPPRMEIRRNAPLETPHILVLIDDETDTFLPALGKRARDPSRNGGKPLYDTNLMLDSGRVRGWKLDGTDEDYIAAGLEDLARRAASRYGAARKYGDVEDTADVSGNAMSGAVEAGASPFLFAVGDGNHSLATAKAVWEEYRAAHYGEPDLMNHPARWALVEIENLYDPALTFEPIHRLILGAGAEAVLRLLEELPGYHCRRLGSAAGGAADGPAAELAALVRDESGGRLRLGVAAGPERFLVEADPVPLAVDAVEPLLERLAAKDPGAAGPGVNIDYIHGTEELLRLAAAPSDTPRTGIVLPPFRKQGLFETVARRGPLPRKSFSMGEAREKRFYLECRQLFG